MESNLNGIIDLHVHTSPDVIPRKYTDFQLVDAAVRVGARAIVIKSHQGSTVERAALCNAYNRTVHGHNGFTMFGGIVLNRPVGGLNPYAVRTALKLGAKIVWLPTVDALNHRLKHRQHGGYSVFDERGAVKKSVKQIIAFVRDASAVLATGHISPREIVAVAEEAKRAGLKRLLITHPEFWVVGLDHPHQLQLVEDYNAYLEHCYSQPLPDGSWRKNLEDTVSLIGDIGASHIVLSTDGGQAVNPPWEEEAQDTMEFLLQRGISANTILQMTHKNPAALLGIS